MLWRIDRARPTPLHEQLAGCARRAVADGSLSADERLPPARDLAVVVGVNTNTVLRAYRSLRAEGLVEFRRGQGVRISRESAGRASVVDAVRQLVELGRRHGYTVSEVVDLVTTLHSEEAT